MVVFYHLFQCFEFSFPTTRDAQSALLFNISLQREEEWIQKEGKMFQLEFEHCSFSKPLTSQVCNEGLKKKV